MPDSSQTTDLNAGGALQSVPTRPTGLSGLAPGNDEGSPAQTIGWQPIETAPRDLFVLIYSPQDEWVALAKWTAGGWYGVDDMGLTFDHPNSRSGPSHWMYVPTGPVMEVKIVD